MAEFVFYDRPTAQQTQPAVTYGLVDVSKFPQLPAGLTEVAAWIPPMPWLGGRLELPAQIGPEPELTSPAEESYFDPLPTGVNCRCGHAKVGHRTVARQVSTCDECGEPCQVY